MIHLENVLKISLQDVLKMSWRRLQNVLKTSWRCLEDVFARRLEDVLKTSWRHLGKTSWKRLEDVLKTYDQDEYIVLIKTSSSRRMFAGTGHFAVSLYHGNMFRSLKNKLIQIIALSKNVRELISLTFLF